jgi:hypothetical protein
MPTPRETFRALLVTLEQPAYLLSFVAIWAIAWVSLALLTSNTASLPLMPSSFCGIVRVPKRWMTEPR